MKALTYNKYRAINIVILSLIFVIAESAVTFGANLWFPELPYTVSLAVIIISLELIRWNAFGAVAALVSGVAFCLASGANPEQFLIYCIGNLFTLFALIFIKTVGSEKIRKNSALCAVYVILVFLLAEVGRGLVAMVLGNEPAILIQFLTTDALSGLFGIIVISIVRNADGMFENQKKYLIRLEEERRAKEMEEY